MHRVKQLQMLIDNSLFSDRAWEPVSIKFRESIRGQLNNALCSNKLNGYMREFDNNIGIRCDDR